MDEINRKIQTARRRVMWNHFLRVITWTLLATLILIAIGIAIPKIWHLAFLDEAEAANFWMAAWVIGGSILGLFLAAGLTIVKRQSLLNVAVEVDRRFGLKSRLSSTLAMSPDDQASVAGAALTQDAAHQADLIGRARPIQDRDAVAVVLAFDCRFVGVWVAVCAKRRG